jgi:hypothetical protein
MNRSAAGFALIAALFGVFAVAEERPYTEGSVWTLTMIRTADGLSETYLESLRHSYKPTLDEAQKQGLVLSWKIIEVNAVGPDDWNLLLLTEYRNWAAFDGLDDKMLPILRKVLSKDQETSLMTERLNVRRIVGDKVGQELILK